MLILKSLVAALVSVPGGCGTESANNLLKDHFLTYRDNLGTKGGSDKRPPKALPPSGVPGHARPQNFSL